MKTLARSPELVTILVTCFCGLLFAASLIAFGVDNRLRPVAGGVAAPIVDGTAKILAPQP